MKARFFVLGLLVTQASRTALADDVDRFRTQYLHTEQVLVDRFIKNIYSKARYIAYELNNNKIEPPMIATLSAVSSGDSTRVTRISPKKKTFTLSMPDNGYGIEELADGKYRIVGQSQSLGDKSVFPRPGISADAPQAYPLRFYDGSLESLMGDVLRNSLLDVKSKFAKVKVASVENGIWNGQETVILTSQFLSGKPTRVFLDPKNNYAYLGFDSETNSGRLEYVSAPGFDYPIPKRFDFWRHPAGKEKVRMYSVEIDEFKRVELMPDDFEIEKQYGLKPLPPNRIIAAKTNPWAKWFYGAGIFFAVVSVVFVIMIRRRRIVSV
jgi:hypothetical protein